MNSMRQSCLGLFLAGCVVIALLWTGFSSAATCEKWVAKVVSVQGTVQVKKADETQWQTVKLNDTYCPGDTIRVLERSRADLALINQPLLRLDQDTTITLNGVKEDRTSWVELVKGAAHFFSRAPRSLGVITGFVNAGVEGTEFFVRVEADRTLLSVYEGKVSASNQAGILSMTGGQSAVAEAGKAPVLRAVARPRDAVQWTLYYPPVLSYRPSDFQRLPEGVQRAIKESIASYTRGDLQGALNSLGSMPEEIRDACLLTYRASLLLAVGRADEARKDIETALNVTPNRGDALTLLSIIAVTQNEKDKALDLAKRAVEADPQSASARIGLSYAQQSNFDLRGALDSLKEAVQLSPENALAWARLSEIWLSFGEIDKAFNVAKKAAELNPDLARTQTVLGFAYLTEIKTGESRKAFEKAIELDQADPLPRLGLGLAKIRDGDLQDGAREIEIAVSLQPNNSLIRSYLGKAYYEEKREKLASDEYRMAKELDPLDPTPFFYDAILKQTTNRPVDALEDLQKAIELNDNRAVYRSRLLLDSDLAARSASLARIYSDLGFQQRALVEGWKSVNTDPADFSGHRFLADTYAVLPRHEIARVSELLISQLLQPINITPIQPRLAESNLFVISGGGPADLSFNEFNPLFNRNRIALQATGLAGEDATWGDEVVVSGIYNKASFSVGQFHNQTDGFRTNNDMRDDIYNAFLQMSLSPQTSLQAEFRHRDIKRGETELRFFDSKPGDPLDDFRSNLRQEDKTDSIRLGFHHAFSPGSDLIGNFMYQHSDRGVFDSPDPILRVFDLDGKDDAFSAEVQHLFSSKSIKTVVGGGYFNINSKDVINTELLLPIDPDLPPQLIRSTTPFPRDVRHGNLYFYSYLYFLKNVTLTAGASGDFFKRELPNGDFKDENQFNPKFGVTWNPFPDNTLRAAVFRALKRTLITNQTLEPTQVAGFNQFFDDDNGTESWRYGIALDQKFSKDIYGGAEFSLRDLKVPFVDTTGSAPELKKVDWNERTGRAYLYWTPHPWMALSAEYLFERLNRDEELAGGAKEVDTHRFPLAISFFHPCGFSAMFKGSFIDQSGSFERQGALGTFIHGSDRFWVFDTALNYRLPKRLGFITVGAKNLFDKSFRFFDSDPLNPTLRPDRLIYAKMTLSF